MGKYVVSIKNSIGNIREINQDSISINGYWWGNGTSNYSALLSFSDNDRVVIAIFDGMGGLNHGEVASGISAKLIAEEYLRDPYFDCERAIFKCNEEVYKESQRTDQMIGSTAVLFEIANGKARAINIGDSRAYLFDNGSLKMISIDHTEKTLFQNISHICSNIKSHNSLTQHLGIPEEEFVIEPSVSEWFEIDNNTLLLCSDGLTSHLSDDKIKQLLSENDDIEAASETLVDNTLRAGGHDNVSVVLLRREKLEPH